MLKPKGYEEAQAFGEFEKIELGGHHMTVMAVEEMVSSKGKPMIKVSLDTALGDKQPTFFMKKYKAAQAPTDGTKKKWPNDGTMYITTENEDGTCSSRLKGFVTAVEKSNPGFAVAWGDGFCNSLKGKAVGAVFRIEMDAYNGKAVERRKMCWFCESGKVAEQKVPEPVQTDDYQLLMGTKASAVADPEFMTVPDEELPFV